MELGYLGFEVSDIGAWSQLCTDIIGMMPAGKNTDGSIAFRMDERRQRLFLRPGAKDDVCAIGLVASDKPEFEACLNRLKKRGTPIHLAAPVVAESRRVGHLVSFEAPFGVPVELSIDPQLDDTPFQSQVAPNGFVTGELGMGHILLLAPDKDEISNFFIDVFGFNISNTGKADWNGMTDARVDFLYCNPRHHTIAPAHVGVVLPKFTGHFYVQRPSVDDVGYAYDRARKAGLHITNELGRHTDGAFSFYAQTPSGFDFEIGTDGYLIDENWKPFELQSYGFWGHRYHAVSG